MVLAVALWVQVDQPLQQGLGVDLGLSLQPLLDSFHIRCEWVGPGALAGSWLGFAAPWLVALPEALQSTQEHLERLVLRRQIPLRCGSVQA